MRTAIIASIVVLLFTAGSAVAIKLYVLDEQPGSRAYRQRATAWSQPAGYPGAMAHRGATAAPEALRRGAALQVALARAAAAAAAPARARSTSRR